MRNQERRSMSWRCALIVAVVLALGSIASESAAQQTRDALIASFGEELQAINGKDLNAVMSHVHEEVILFGLYSPFPVVGKAAFRQAVQDYFDSFEEANLNPAHEEYMVIGETGVAWGLYQLTTKPKDGMEQTVNGQYMFTYARPSGQWQIVSWHFSPLPGGN